MFQANPMRCFHFYFLVLSWCLLIPKTHELEADQTQALLQLRTNLEYPPSTQVWENYYNDLCSLPSSSHVSIKCEDNSITELKIMGDKSLKSSSRFNGFAIPNQTLSINFSIDSFFTTLTKLTNLKVLSLVSLGIYGRLPNNIHSLSSLQVLDLSSNFLFGTIPPKISTMVNLHSLTLDDNYFNTTIPNWFDSLSNLNILSLKNNTLKGSFPSSLCKIKTLEVISFSHNEISGPLPSLTSLTSLHVLDIRENHLDSNLPLLPKEVVTILLSNNSFSGEIQGYFGKLDNLQHLDVSSNQLSGRLPCDLFNLPKISYLNLANNVLSGSLSEKVVCGSKLGYVDISKNKLSGELPSCLANNSNSRVVRFGRNCLSFDYQNQQRGSYCEESGFGWKKFMVWKVVVIVGLAIVLLVSSVLLCKKYQLKKKDREDLLPKTVQDNSSNGVSSQILANASKYKNYLSNNGV